MQAARVLQHNAQAKVLRVEADEVHVMVAKQTVRQIRDAVSILPYSA